MHKLVILSIFALLASTSGVLAEAEAEADLQQPVEHGAVAGEAAEKAVACGMRVPADPWIGVSDACIVGGTTPIQPAPANVATARSNPHETTPIQPAPVDMTRVRRNPHETAPIRPASVDEASLPIVSE